MTIMLPLLAGLRVIDLSRVMSGPYCTAMLADLGAEVIKLETLQRGDDSRHFGPFVADKSVYFALLNRNKKSLAIDLRHAQAAAVVRALVATADVVVENFRPGVAARLGLDYPTLLASAPRLVYLSISGFGQDGPCARRPAYDLIIQAMSGLMSTTGSPQGEPSCVGESIGDVATGMFGAFAICAALFARERTGLGQHIDLAMFDALYAMQMTGLAQLAASGHPPVRVGNRHPLTVPVDTFHCRDGLVALVVPSDVHFTKLCTLMGQAELASDLRFVDNQARARHEAQIHQIVEAWTEKQSVQAIVEACTAVDLPCGPVWDLSQSQASDHARARQLTQTVDHPAFGHLPLVTQPARFSAAPAARAMREPDLGQHTDELLRDLGFSAKAIAEMRYERVVG